MNQEHKTEASDGLSAITGAFGMTFNMEKGGWRRWVIGRDGVKRWEDNNKPVEDISQDKKEIARLREENERLRKDAELAVIAERDACAKFVDHILKEGGGTYGDAIRARSNA